VLVCWCIVALVYCPVGVLSRCCIVVLVYWVPGVVERESAERAAARLVTGVVENEQSATMVLRAIAHKIPGVREDKSA
jgi:hypothetical protein